MNRLFAIPGIFILFCAFVLSLVTSISVPYLPALDMARVHFNTNGNMNGTGLSTANSNTTYNQIRFGIWGHCEYAASNGDRTCSSGTHPYTVTLGSTSSSETQTIGKSWTRGLAIHPVATIIIFIAFLLSFSAHMTITLITSLLSFLAAFLTFIAFLCDIALFAYVRKQVNRIDGLEPHSKTGAGFWLTFVTFLLLLLAGVMAFIGRRRARLSNATASGYPTTPATEKYNVPFWKRFRRTY